MIQITYKLIKKYPSLPTDWEENMIVGIGDIIKDKYSPCNGKYKDFYISITEVENNPEFWQKVEEKKVLFTCEDGVDLFKDNKYFIVDRNFLIDTRTAYLGSSSFTNKEYHSFSTKEKAEEYVYFAKPRFSFKDVEKAIMNAEIIGNKEFIKNLIYTSLEKNCL